MRFVFSKKTDKKRGAVRKQQPSKPLHFRLPKLLPVVIFALLAGLSWGLYQASTYLTARPVDKVVVNGQLRHVDRQQVIEEIKPYLTKGFFMLPLSEIKKQLEHMPWVYEVSLQRQWPHTIAVEISEQQAIANWRHSGFLNHRGEGVVLEDYEKIKELPMLSGPEGSESLVMNNYRAINYLLREKGLRLSHLSLSDRSEWLAEIEGGIVLHFGKDQLMEKMRRFIAVYDRALKQQIHNVKKVDMRYGNGLAVAWQKLKGAKS